jgi:asparaginyl-tRNA synthetase
MDYDESFGVLDRLKQKFEFPVSWGRLQSEPERYLTEQYAKAGHVMNYQKTVKTFYMRANDGGGTVAAIEVLALGIDEIIGGSQREDWLEILNRNMAERGIDKEHYAWYHDLRRYGTGPHAGFGLVFERTLARRRRSRQCPRRDPLPAHAGRRAVLTLRQHDPPRAS